MTISDIARRRLIAQALIQPRFETPNEAVRWFGAAQAQEYGPSLWALGQRMTQATEAQVAQAMDDGSIIRTHTMRGTWHWIAPEDFRWFMALTGKRQLAKYGHYFRKLGLEDALLNRGREVLIRALEGGKQLTKKELETALDAAGITVPNLGSTFVLIDSEGQGVIASGARRGKQFTYRLVDEWLPAAAEIERDEALAKIVERYFVSHGPATIQDFVWWSGLTVADTKIGLELAKSKLAQQIIDGASYWFSPALPDLTAASPDVHLLPPFDEYSVAYRDRSAAQHSLHEQTKDPFVLLSPIIVADGRVVGTWRRKEGKKDSVVTLKLFGSLTSDEKAALDAVIERYSAFIGQPANLVWAAN